MNETYVFFIPPKYTYCVEIYLCPAIPVLSSTFWFMSLWNYRFHSARLCA